MEIIYKILPRELWREAETTGFFYGAPVDLKDGFIHFSGQEGLLLIAVNAPQLGKLGLSLKWEPARGGDLFPHLYGALPLSCVLWVRPLSWSPGEGESQGRHQFPEAFQ